MPVPERTASSGSLPEAIRLTSEEFSTETAQLYKEDSKIPGEYKYSRTHSEFYSQILLLAYGLIDLGLPSGAMVSILSENRPEWNISDFAILHNGCTTVGIYTNDSVEHIEFKMIDTQSYILFVEDKKQLGKVLSIPATDIPSVQHLVVYDCKDIDLASDPRLVSYESLIERGAAAGGSVRNELRKRLDGISLGTLARLVYTSGTSGNPKGAMLTHGNLLSNAVAATDSLRMTAGDLLISFLPEAHVLQTILSLCALLNGGGLGYSFRKTLAADLTHVRPTLFPGVQRVWAKFHLNIEKNISGGLPKLIGMVSPGFLTNMIKKKAGIDRVRFFVSGAGKLEPYTYDFFHDRLGVTIFLGYGLSETSPVISVNNERDNKKGSSGKPIPGVEVKVVDAFRKEVPIGTTGEIATRGPNVFVGYYNQEARYKAVMDDEGWFYTGDRGYIDDDGFVFVLGRAGNRVKFSDGEHHDLEEISSRIMGFTKLLQQMAVFGEGKDYPVVICSLTDEEDDLRSLAKQLGVEYTSRDEFAYLPEVVKACREDFEQARQRVIDEFKIPGPEDIKKALYIRPMSEDNAEKTPTQKTRLNFIFDRYSGQIEELYASKECFMVHKA
ncbi:MAG TPA: AMP-binding protein [bacterium]|nr:AMP-binding protein [bacterium]